MIKKAFTLETGVRPVTSNTSFHRIAFKIIIFLIMKTNPKDKQWSNGKDDADGNVSRGRCEVTHHPPVGCRELHEHFIAKNIQRSEGNTQKTKKGQTDTKEKDVWLSPAGGGRDFSSPVLVVSSDPHLVSSRAAMLITMNWRQESFSCSALYTVANSSSSAPFFRVTEGSDAEWRHSPFTGKSFHKKQLCLKISFPDFPCVK